MAPSPFEDNYSDILKKSMFGLGISEETAATRTGVNPVTLHSLLEGIPNPDQTSLEQLAVLLELSPEKLVHLALNPGQPRPIILPDNIEMIPSTASASSNCYLIRCPISKTSFIIDPGGDPDSITQKATAGGYKFTAMFLTHGHADHTGGAGKISASLGIPALALDSENGRIQGAIRATFVKNGYGLRTKSFTLRFILVPGHTPGHGIICAEGLGLAFTGDALFARSVGNACAPGGAYKTQLLAVREIILELPWETIICPGHGPMTTVADEKTLNPFFL